MQMEIDNLELFFDKFLDVLYDGIYITDSQGKTIKMNRAYELMTGLKKEELIGRHVLELKRQGYFDTPQNPVVMKTKKTTTDVQIIKEGKKVLVMGVPIFNDHNPSVVDYVITFVRDITVLSQLTTEIAAQKEIIENFLAESIYHRKKQFDKSVVVQDPAMIQLMISLEKVAKTDANVILLGETGVGKDVFARKIHEYSGRREGPFFKINCAAIPDNLIESELFGYEPGAFTGSSTKGKSGYFELANGGTIFLDEIGELSVFLQAKLLQVLQDKEVMRVGGVRTKKIDVRLVAATNRNLEHEVRKGSFRKDLYYRLKVATFEIPPLRKRQQEIIPLIKFFLERFNKKYKKKIEFTSNALVFLKNYDWPGNVREMENLIEGLVIAKENGLIDEDQILYLFNYCTNLKEEDRSLEDETNLFVETGGDGLKDILKKVEKNILRQMLEKHFHNVTRVAGTLKINRSTLYRKLEEYNLI